MSVLVVTPGEPAGIGADVLLQVVAEGLAYPVVAIADVAFMQERARLLSLNVHCISIDENDLDTYQATSGELAVLHVPLNTPVVVGQLNKANARYVLATLDKALQLCLSNKAAALVTGPVHKGVINDSGLAFTGHTEYLRDHSGIDEVVMMLATEGLRVALVTTHLPLKEVSAAVTFDKIIRVSTILHQSLITYFGAVEPRILVAGLNPHAGEDGHLGREELDIIIPALTALQNKGIVTKGPLPADTLFQPHYLENADAVLAMYHDQGLPVLKYKGFGNAVNITLGLPFIRTSVDHGTALDLAGTGRVDTGSIKVALKTAYDMARQKENHHA